MRQASWEVDAASSAYGTPSEQPSKLEGDSQSWKGRLAIFALSVIYVASSAAQVLWVVSTCT